MKIGKLHFFIEEMIITNFEENEIFMRTVRIMRTVIKQKINRNSKIQKFKIFNIKDLINIYLKIS